MAKYALDDSARFTSGGTLNKIQKAIIGVCIKDLSVMPKSICDFNKDEIGDIEDGLKNLKDFINSEEFGGGYYSYNSLLEDSFEKNSIQYDVSNESKKKSTKRLILIEITKIEKLLKDYAFVFKYSQDLEDSKKFIDKILSELKKVKVIEDFEDLITDYTADDYKKFNNFLRKRNFRNVSPKDYAEMCKKIKVLKDGLIKRKMSVNENGLTLYRHTSLNGIIGMLSGSGVVPKNWLRLQKKQFEEKCKREDKNIQEDEAKKKETDKEKKERRTKEYNKMLAGKILTFLNKKPVISDRAFLSTSYSETSTNDFGENKLVINCEPGTIRGTDVTDLSRASEEEEVLFVPNQRFKVTRATDTSNDFLSPPCFEITLKTI